MSAVDIATATADDFEPRLNDRFDLRTAGGEVVLTLAQVRRLGHARRPGGAFSLLFMTGGGPDFPQATYALSHPALGAIALFLVPIGPVAGGGRGYEAVFT